MTNELTTNFNLATELAKLEKLSTEKLREGAESAIFDTTSGYVRVCLHFKALMNRGEKHPRMFKGIFRWFESVADGSLNPEIVTKFFGDDQIISRIITLPPETQSEIAETGEVTIVELDKGKIVEVKKPVLQMNTKQLDQVFDKGKLRSIPQQIGIVNAAPPKSQKSTPLVQASPDGEYLIVGGIYTVAPNMLIEPLRALGFTIMKRQ